MRRDDGRKLMMSNDLDQLPEKDVGEFIRQLARRHNISHQRSALDDWVEAVSMAAGDHVQLDCTEKLLVELRKKRIISGRQAARLLTNYMRENGR